MEDASYCIDTLNGFNAGLDFSGHAFVILLSVVLIFLLA